MIKSIIQHELNLNIFKRKTWYLLATVFSFMSIIFNWLINNYLAAKSSVAAINYGVTEEVIHPYYAWFSLIVLFFIPNITTQAICAEKNRGTILNYYCSAINGWQFIIAKFIALNLMLIAFVCLISLLPLTVTLSGSLDWGQFISSFVGIYLMLSAALAVGLSISASMHNIARCNLSIFLALVILTLLEWGAQFASGPALLLQKFGFLYPLKDFLNGIISLHNCSYYLLLSLLFLAIASYKFKKEEYNA